MRISKVLQFFEDLHNRVEGDPDIEFFVDDELIEITNGIIEVNYVTPFARKQLDDGSRSEKVTVLMEVPL